MSSHRRQRGAAATAGAANCPARKNPQTLPAPGRASQARTSPSVMAEKSTTSCWQLPQKRPAAVGVMAGQGWGQGAGTEKAGMVRRGKWFRVSE